MERIKLNILKVLTAFSAVVLLLLLTSLFVLNSGLLDRLAKEKAIALFNEKLVGHLELQELHLKFPNRVTLIRPRIYGPGDKTPALKAQSVSLKFNFLTLLQPKIKRIYLRHLTADSLSAKVASLKNGKLNLEVIFTSRDPDSTRNQLEHFYCKNLEINNGDISYSGYSKNGKETALGVKNINLDLSKFTVKKNLVRGSLDKLQCNAPDKRFVLRDASGQFLFSETRSEILALKAAGNKSSAELSVTVDHFNIFASQLQKELTRCTSFVALQKLALNSEDLKLLYPGLLLPDGIYTLKGNAKGKKDNIVILDASATHLKSRVAVKGELLNLKNREAFAYRLTIDSSRIAVPFVESVLKGSSYSDRAAEIGNITFFGHAQGTLHAVKTDITTRSELGEVTLNGEALGDKSDAVACKGTFGLKGFKPLKLINRSGDERCLVNATGSFAGSAGHKTISQLSLDMKFADSYWHALQVKEGTVSLKYDGVLLKSALALSNRQTSVSLEGDIDWRDKTPRYRASGKTGGLNVSDILGSNALKTDLNGSFAVEGSGYDPKNLNFAAVMQFLPSTIDGIKLKDHSKASFEIAQTSGSSRVNVTSDFFDVLVDGDYSVDELISLSRLAGSGISREIAAQNIWQTPLAAPVAGSNALKRPFTVNYRITVKDMAPLAALLPLQGLSFQGSADGRADYRDGLCSIGSSINLARLQSGNSLLFENLAVKGEVECRSSGTQKASLSGRSSAVNVGRKKTGAAIFSALYLPSHLDCTLDVVLPNPAQNLSTKFSTTRDGSAYNLLFNQLLIKDGAEVWKAGENSRIMLGKTAARFNRFTIAKGIQQAVLDGELSNSQPASFQCTLSNMELDELKRFSLSPSFDKLSGTVNASLAVSGSPELKKTTLNVSGTGIRYDKFMIGTFQCNALHNDNILRFEMHSSVPPQVKSTDRSVPGMNTIEGSGTVPLALNFYPLQVRMADQQPIKVALHSDNLSAQSLTYLLPFFESAEGIIPTTLKIEGRTPKPDIYLTTVLRDTKIKVEPTQVSYVLNGEVSVTPNALELRNISIRDNHKGHGNISGVVTLEKLQPMGLDLGGRMDNLLVFDKKDREDETSFGSITCSTSNIQLHGTLSSPQAEGELRINAADYSLYRTGSNENAKYVGINKFIEFVPRYPAVGLHGIERDVPSKSAEFYHSVLDILQIKNLKVTSVEPLKYTIIFDRLRGEKLETSINNLALNVNKNNQQYRLFGSVNITGGKYKFSNTNFDLQDGGRINWNNVDIRSGVMENLYGNKFVSTTNLQTSERDNVKLLIAITGSINDPLVTMGYYLNEQSQPYASTNLIGGKSSQIDPNAELNVISMLLSKQWYARPGSSALASNIAVSSVGMSAGSGLLSSQFSKIVQDFAGIESFTVNVGMDKRGALSGLDLYLAVSVPGTDGKVRFIGSGSAPTLRDSPLSNYYGTEQKIEYRVTPKIYLESYRSYGLNANGTSSTNLQAPSEIWGASISYRERFQTWEQFWKRLFPSSDKKNK